MDLELRALRSLTTRLPRLTGAGVLGNVVRDFYTRRKRSRVVVPVRGVLMELDPAENVDGNLLFCPQLYDRRELRVLLEALRPGDVFVDVGAHIGLYALLAARRVAPGGRVVAIEADPYTHARLADNVRRNPELAVDPVCVAVSDTEGSARLALNTTGNRGGNSLLVGGDDTIEVSCRRLADVLADRGIEKVDGMKLDIEGMEYRVLRRFLADVPDALRPRVVVLEHQADWIEEAGGDAVELLVGAGYRSVLETRLNRVMVRG